MNVVARHDEAAERALHLVERQAGVDEGAQDHVAGNPRKAIEVQHATHKSLSSLKLQYATSPRIM